MMSIPNLLFLSGSLVAFSAAHAQQVIVPYRQLGAFYLGQNIGNAMNSFVEASRTMKESNAELTAEITAARRTFWSAFDEHAKSTPDHPELQAAAQEFAEELRDKDLGLMLLMVPEGPNGPRTKLLEMMMGKIDGGIPQPALKLYNRWVIAIREELGAKVHDGRTPDIVAFSSTEVERILTNTAPIYDRYKYYRDWSEYQMAGKSGSQFYRTWEEFFFLSVKYFGKAGSWGRFETLTDVEAQALVDRIVKESGVEPVRQACEQLIAADWVNPLSLKDAKTAVGSPHYTVVYGAFNHLMASRSQGRIHAVATLALWESGFNWADAIAHYETLRDQYGEAKVLDAITEVQRILGDLHPNAKILYEGRSYRLTDLFSRILDPSSVPQKTMIPATSQSSNPQTVKEVGRSPDDGTRAEEEKARAALAQLMNPMSEASIPFMTKRLEQIRTEILQIEKKHFSGRVISGEESRPLAERGRYGPGRPAQGPGVGTRQGDIPNSELLPTSSSEADREQIRVLRGEELRLNTAIQEAQWKKRQLESTLREPGADKRPSAR